LTTRSAGAIQGHLAWNAGILVNYGWEPFIIKSCPVGTPCETIPVVENIVSADVLASLTLIERIQLGLKIPVTWAEGHGLQEAADGSVEARDGELSAVGLGDVQLEVKGLFYGQENQPIALGAFLYGTAPTGTATAADSYIGSSGPTFGGGLIADGDLGPFSYGVNVGGVARKAAVIGSSKIGSELRWGAAAGFEISPVIAVVGDAYGTSNFSSDLGANNIELDGGFKVNPLGKQLSFTIGGGAGLLKGVGVPAARAFLGAAWDATVLDRDGDGISDDKDACAEAPEDLDGFEDGDGCPELDNDRDGIPDEADKCIDQVEDLDNFEDNDGCPDPDNDRDGIPDAEDECPNDAETKNGFEDEDGCPDVKDSDGDGVGDEDDKCPDEAEDTDGFEDTDGCPDPDNDQDSIPDNQDECIDLPEDGEGEGRQKEDGCPIDA
jgi:hypothetical protein